jgi:hypothetical protein
LTEAVFEEIDREQLRALAFKTIGQAYALAVIVRGGHSSCAAGRLRFRAATGAAMRSVGEHFQVVTSGPAKIFSHPSREPFGVRVRALFVQDSFRAKGKADLSMTL